MKRKNIITLLSLIVVLAGLAIAYFIISKWKDKQETEKEKEVKDTSVTIASFPTGTIDSISVKSDKYNYAVCFKDSSWQLQGDAEFPLDTTRADKMAAVLEEFLATRLVVEDAPDLTEYGLALPVLKVAVTNTSGISTVICIGDRSSADGGYYTCLEGSSSVYLTADTNRSAFYLEEEKLVLLDSVPSFDSAYAAGLKVSSDVYPEFTVADSPEDEYDLTARGLYPYSLYNDVFIKPVHVEMTSFASLMENYASIDLGDMISYHKSELENYGLAQPKTALTVWYTDGSSKEKSEFTIYFGNLTEDGAKRCVRLEGSNQVFAMDSEQAETLLAADTFSIVSKYSQMVNIAILGGVDVSYGDTQRKLRISHAPEAEDSAAVKDFFTVDGKELNDAEESDAFRDIYQVLIGLKITGGLDQKLTVKDESVLTLEFFEDETMDKLLTVRYLPIEGDNASYAVETNGVCVFMADIAAIEGAVAALYEYQP